MDFETKADVVAQCWLVVRNSDDPHWQELVTYGDIGFPLAYAYDQGFVTELSRSGIAEVEDLYTLILKTLMLDPDSEFASFDAMLDENIARQGG